MGGIISGLLGGIGSYFGAKKQADAAKHAADLQAANAQKAADYALTGFNYLRGSDAANQYINNGAAANEQQAQLLGTSPITGATETAFKNYLGSTGYNFNLQQGTDAIASQQAASGMLGSGATGKALTKFGQNLGGQYFNNYLSQLGGLSTSGLAGLQMTGQAGSQGGAAAAGALGYNPNTASQALGSAQSDATNSIWGTLGGAFGQLYNNIPKAPQLTV